MKKSIHKCLAVLLALVLALQCAPASAAAFEPKTYTGSVLAAINTAYTASADAERFETDCSAGAEPGTAHAASFDAANPCDPLGELIRPMAPDEAARAEAASGSAVKAQRTHKPYHIGDTRKIPPFPDTAGIQSNLEFAKWLADYVHREKITLSCVYVNDVCTVWIEDANVWTKAEIRDLGEYAADAIAQLEDLFGTARIDSDGDGKFAVFIHSMPQTDSQIASAGGKTVGYFSQADLADSFGRIGNVWMKSMIASAMIYGAKADCVHINMECNGLGIIKETFVHEYQHYIHTSYQFDGKTNKTCLNADEAYINEGFSMASEMILTANETLLNKNIKRFNAAQKDFSLVTWEDHTANYGLAFVFCQYIRTRYAFLTGGADGKYPGKGIYKQVLQSRNQSNMNNTLGIIADLLYPAGRYAQLADTDARCRQLITDFWLAVYYKNPQGEHGFNGEAWADGLCVNAQTLSDTQTLRSAMSAFYPLENDDRHDVTVLYADEDIRFVPITQPVRTVTLDPNGGFGDAETYSTVQTQFHLPALTQAPVFRPGYAFTGWGLTADAATPDFAPAQTIPLKESLTLYAIWKLVAQIRLRSSNAFCQMNGQAVCAEFCPPEDGVYYLDSDEAYRAIIINEEGVSDEILLSVHDGVYLREGKPYTLYITFRPEDQNDCITGSFILQQRSVWYTLRYFADRKPDPESENGGCNYMQTYRTTFTVQGFDTSVIGKDFIGWSTVPDDTQPTVLPGEQITLTGDTDLYAVWSPWAALHADEPYTVEANSVNLRFVPDKTAVYRVKVKPSDKQYLYTLSGEKTAIDDQYSMCTESRTYTMYAGQTYYITAGQIESVCVERVSEKLQHSLYLYVYSGLGKRPIPFLSVEMSGQNTYTLPDYTPVSFGCKSFEYWQNPLTGEKYYPGDTLVLETDTVLGAASTSVYRIDNESLSAIQVLQQIGVMLLRYIPVWFRCAAQRVRCFGFGHLRFTIPWLGIQ